MARAKPVSLSFQEDFDTLSLPAARNHDAFELNAGSTSLYARGLQQRLAETYGAAGVAEPDTGLSPWARIATIGGISIGLWMVIGGTAFAIFG